MCDSGTEFEGLKIWGSPWVKSFPEMNPLCMAFTRDTEGELAEKFKIIPKDVDILITHSPPHCILDGEDALTPFGEMSPCYGSSALCDILYMQKIRPKLHVYGHIHEGYGHIPKVMDMPGVQLVNASHVNKQYEPVNKPIRVIL